MRFFSDFNTIALFGNIDSSIQNFDPQMLFLTFEFLSNSKRKFPVANLKSQTMNDVYFWKLSRAGAHLKRVTRV